MWASSSTCSSSTISHGGKYDLFVSFRGEDVRDGFLSHLRDALSRKQIDFFIDEKLQGGDEIWPGLSSAIEESRISLVIFSKDYASSKWCLRELVKILECKEEKKQIVMPVFYHVDPRDVRKQRGSFEDAFVNHENVSEEEKQKWRAALTEASNLCGRHFSAFRSFGWHGYPFKVLPPSFDPEKLVELVLPFSNVEQLWEGTKQAPKLKSLDLYGSPKLTKIPDLSDIPLIERIYVGNCKSLLNIHSSVRYLSNLCCLDMSGCENLRSFPSDIQFEARGYLALNDCINLNKFPQISGNIRELYLSGTGIEEVPSSIQNLNELVRLHMSKCTRLKCISTGICRVKSLCHLSLDGCSELESFPEILEIMYCWESLCLDETAIKELPSSIEHLKRLRTLSLRGCKYLEMLPSSLCNLSSLTDLHLSSGSKLEKLVFEEPSIVKMF